MNKIINIGKVIADGLLIVLIAGFFILPISFVGLAGVENKAEVLSEQDIRYERIKGELIKMEVSEGTSTKTTNPEN